MPEKFIGRFAVMDNKGYRIGNDQIRIDVIHNDAPRMTADGSIKTKIASFNGSHFSAEHDTDGNMSVFAHTDEQGRPAQKFGNEEGTSGIKSSAGSHAHRAYAQKAPEEAVKFSH